MSGALQGRKMCDEGAAEPEPEFEGCFGGAECLTCAFIDVSWIGFKDATPLQCVGVYIGSLLSSALEEG